jgi:hypothetical protein
MVEPDDPRIGNSQIMYGKYVFDHALNAPLCESFDPESDNSYLNWSVIEHNARVWSPKSWSGNLINVKRAPTIEKILRGSEQVEIILVKEAEVKTSPPQDDLEPADVGEYDDDDSIMFMDTIASRPYRMSRRPLPGAPDNLQLYPPSVFALPPGADGWRSSAPGLTPLQTP